MTSTPVSLTLTKAEYALIAGVLGASTLIGIDDPFKGYLADELRAELDKTLDGLVKRGVAELRADRRVVFDQTLGLVCATCGFPEAVYTLTRTNREGVADQHLFFITRTASAEMVHSAHNSLTLTKWETPQQVVARVLALLKLTEVAALELPAAVLPQASLSAAVAAAQASGAEAALAALVEAGVDQATADALSKSLTHPDLNASFVSLAQKGAAWESGGVALLLGAGQLWKLQPVTGGTEAAVAVLPCTTAAMKEELVRVVQGALPPAVPVA
ncbi:MAG: hypothetical protein K0R39_3182 [Symbiobacteriaceae bacterium]|jgi:hypothetical protein|nr:hypothetical protein [Symbiobacteriaceae bacterium]